MNSDPPIVELTRLLETGGLRSGLQWLNSRVPHRYTVVYRFDGDAFYAVEVIDKRNEAPPELFSKVPFDVSFCQYSVTAGVFDTSNSMEDERLVGHVHRANVQSYTGLPLTRPSGELCGTFCHLDFVPQNLPAGEFDFLRAAVLILSPFVPMNGIVAEV